MQRFLVLLLACGCGAQLDSTVDPPLDPGKGDDPSGGGSGSGSGAALTAGGFLTQIGNAECERAFACRDQFPATPGDTFELEFGATLDECHALADQVFTPALVDAAVAAGTVRFDASAAATCLAGTTQGAECIDFFVNGPAFDASCSDVFAGTVAPGGTCTVDEECISDACDVANATCSN